MRSSGQKRLGWLKKKTGVYLGEMRLSRLLTLVNFLNESRADLPPCLGGITSGISHLQVSRARRLVHFVRSHSTIAETQGQSGYEVNMRKTFTP